MAGKSDFTAEEWWLLKETPMLAGAAVMVAADSGVGGTLHEMVANATSFVNAAKLFPNNALIRDLVTPDEGTAYKPALVETSDPNQKARDERVKADALTKCSSVADLLERKCDPQTAQEYKQWLMAIGGDVASAAEEGGVLGFGKKRVSEPEVKLLVELAAALRHAPYAPPSD